MGLVDQGLQACSIRGEAPAVVTGELTFRVGYERHLVHRQAALTQVAHAVHEVVKRVAFHIELAIGPGFEQLRQVQHILRADVAGIRARVHRDTRGARLQAQSRCAGDAGNAEVAGVAHQRYFVQVDGEMGFHRF